MQPCCYTQTTAMCNLSDVFAADILYHDYCCKGYFNKYHAKIEEIMKNLEMENSITAEDTSLKARFLALDLGRFYWSGIKQSCEAANH